MIEAQALRRWMDSLPPGARLAIDKDNITIEDDGLTLYAFEVDGTTALWNNGDIVSFGIGTLDEDEDEDPVWKMGENTEYAGPDLSRNFTK